MLRRYAQTLERITGADVPHTRRDGRQFTEAHVRTLLQCKALIDANSGLSVETALRMALSAGDGGLEHAVVPATTPDALALADALRDAITGPLVAELRELRREVQELQDRRPPPNELPDGVPEGAAAGDGPLVRGARWLERLLRGRGR